MSYVVCHVPETTLPFADVKLSVLMSNVRPGEHEMTGNGRTSEPCVSITSVAAPFTLRYVIVEMHQNALLRKLSSDGVEYLQHDC
jgi:hypothetical protein